MSHTPPPKCWTCATPMTGESMAMTRFECRYCGFHSCGRCLFEHTRKAHPADFMEDFMPAVRRNNLDAPTPLVRPAARDNVVPLRRTGS